MKIQLDTINKTISIEEDVNLHDFHEQINALLPNGLWREFTLKVTKITEWRDPITITPNTPISPGISPLPNTFPPYDNPCPPLYPQVWYTTSTNTDTVSLNKGIYNIITKD